MDSRRFDRLTRLFGAGLSRRRALTTLIGGAGAAASVGIGTSNAAVRKRVFGQACSKNADCTSSLCLAKDARGHRYCGCGPTSCDAGFICIDNSCQPDPQGTCASGADLCAGNVNFGCNDSPGCFCSTTLEGSTACVDDSDAFVCGCLQSSDCNPGWVCVKDNIVGCGCPIDGHPSGDIGFCEPLCLPAPV